VGHPALGEVIRADSLVAHTRAHLAAALAGHLVGDAGLLDLVELAGQHLHALFPVLYLAALLLAGHHDARGLVDEAHRRGGLVDVLPAGARRAGDLLLAVFGVTIYVHGLP